MHKFNNVEANDLKIAAEEATGQNLSWFFDQWLYKDGHPIYDVTEKYEPENALVRMIVNQTQPRDSMTGTFKMPIDVEIVFEDGSTDIQTIRDQDSTQTFTLICPKKPVNVIFDKGNSTLKDVHVHKSVNEWLYQLQHSVPAIERSEAAQELGSGDYAGDASVIDALAKTASGDKFWATRSYALTSLAHVTDSLKGYEKLVVDEATKDPNPDVRQNAVWLLLRLSDHALALQAALDAVNDSSYQIHGSAIRVVNKLDRKRGYELALKALGEKAPRDNIRYAAIGILRETKSEEALDRLITLIGERNIPKRTRWETINAIGDFAEFDSVKTYTALWNLTKNGDREIINTAYNRLGDIGGEQTLLRIKLEAANHPDLSESFMNIRERMHKRLDPTLIKEQQEQEAKRKSLTK
jgi:aminopeptidase N